MLPWQTLGSFHLPAAMLRLARALFGRWAEEKRARPTMGARLYQVACVSGECGCGEDGDGEHRKMEEA